MLSLFNSVLVLHVLSQAIKSIYTWKVVSSKCSITFEDIMDTITRLSDTDLGLLGFMLVLRVFSNLMAILVFL